ncbi:MAG: 50S ribosomal protein L2 [Candidatus Margulisbacteria bacterium]|nr:50S ribosomal protein L2 [Candidatus Margulisiibacteriota bacterium]MBU1022104.1 50S ribosomal protein L2 [Candidatus Margulisiibacteriota bacterium]MBU1729699.1 50S ribosomal protein L2 [Candidatus Margulisiibacteriota bacterium]MBU1955019.1 50S ribosomal protein L2 [Candidatus Margulisiibacteriota bacterium]
MAVKPRRPLTPGQRFRVDDPYDDLTASKPEKSLLRRIKKHAGRNNSGKITMRHRGGGNKKFYRLIDFKRIKDNVPAKVVSIEYDPFRNARIALLHYADGEKSYIIAPLKIKVGDEVMSGPEAEIRPGCALPMKNIPVGTTIHNVELNPGKGGQMGRSAGSVIVLVAKEGNFGIIKLPSGEQRMVNINCRASIGQVGNPDAKNVILGKAGRMRHLGRRPMNRGTSMNPCDHPHGGGEGRAGVGRKRPVSKWGKPAQGALTRHNRKGSSKFILARRPK